jgi:hypothetical protein
MLAVHSCISIKAVSINDCYICSNDIDKRIDATHRMILVIGWLLWTLLAPSQTTIRIFWPKAYIRVLSGGVATPGSPLVTKGSMGAWKSILQYRATQ